MQELEIRNYKRLDEKDDNAISWPRVAGITAAIAVHAAALLFMLAPMAPPPVAQADEDVTVVNIIKPPPPPPPPPPPEPIKEVIKLK
jgi:protein TonB